MVSWRWGGLGPVFNNFGDVFTFTGRFRFLALDEVFVNCGTAGASEGAGQGTDGKADEAFGGSESSIVGVTFQ